MKGDFLDRPCADPEGEFSISPFDGPDSEWDTLLTQFPEATFCHLAGWRQVFRQVMGHESHFRVARDPQGEVRGLLPLTEVRSRLFGHYLLSMPFLSYGGPLGSESAQRALVRAAVDEARRLDADLLEFRSRSLIPGGLVTSRPSSSPRIPTATSSRG